MAYNENLAGRVRQALTGRSDIAERAMFGGLAFMARGHMCCGLVEDKLMIRVDPNAYDQLLEEPGAQPMDFTGRPMRGFLYVTGAGISTSKGLHTWILRALDFAESRPPKASRTAQAKSARRPDNYQASRGQVRRSSPFGRREKPKPRKSKRDR